MNEGTTGRGGPGRTTEGIAHRAGNDRAALQLAIEAGVDWIEVDCWWHYGRLIARHEQPVWRLPFVYDKWRLALAAARPLYLPELIERSIDGPRLFIDFKGPSQRLPAGVVDLLRSRDAVDRAAICGQVWPLLDAAARLEPALRVVHSFGTPRQIEAMRLRPRTLPPITAASVYHLLLTPAAMQEFRQRGVAVYAWTVNDPGRAAELVKLGVSGIISDRLDLLRGLPDGQEVVSPRPSRDADAGSTDEV